MICVILQPTFLPWIGWFDLADQSGATVILDDVQFSKQSWQQRNRIRTPNGLEYLSVPVKTAGRLGQLILDCESVEHPFIPKMLKSLKANYARAPYFADMIEDFAASMQSAGDSGRLVELNCALISWMANRLGINVPMVRASTLGAGGQRCEHVASICERVGADRYLSPSCAEDYLMEDREAFDRRGITVWIHAYEHPVYTQCFTPFMPYASALDMIFNVGPGALQVMRSGRRSANRLGARSQSDTKEHTHEDR